MFIVHHWNLSNFKHLCLFFLSVAQAGLELAIPRPHPHTKTIVTGTHYLALVTDLMGDWRFAHLHCFIINLCSCEKQGEPAGYSFSRISQTRKTCGVHLQNRCHIHPRSSKFTTSTTNILAKLSYSKDTSPVFHGLPWWLFYLFIVFETATRAGLGPETILLPQAPKCRYYKHYHFWPHLISFSFLFIYLHLARPLLTCYSKYKTGSSHCLAFFPQMVRSPFQVFRRVPWRPNLGLSTALITSTAKLFTCLLSYLLNSRGL